MSTPRPVPISAPMWLLRPWRFGKRVKSASRERLESATGSCIRWEIGSGALVVVGLVGEFVVAINHPAYDSFWGTWAPVLGDFLVATGVALEIIFSAIGHLFSRELTERSDKELGEAIERAAAAELEIEILRTRLSPRSIRRANLETFVEMLRAAGPGSVNLWHLSGDAEAVQFSDQLRQAFTRAGWVANKVGGFASETRDGAVLHLPDKTSLQGMAVRDALRVAEVDFAEDEIPEISGYTGYLDSAAIDLYIGPKPVQP